MASKLEIFQFFMKEALRSMWRNKVMTVASVSTVVISVFILGVFGILFQNSSNIAQYLENSVQITVYMKDNATDDQTNIIGSEIAALPGVVKVDTVSKEQALKRFKERLGENSGILDALDENPLPYSFDVHVDSPKRVMEIIPKIQGMSYVDSAKYGKDVVDKLFQFTKVLRYGGIVIIALMGIGTFFIVANTIKLTVYARRKEIKIMRYVGATDSFVSWPFMMEGIFIGIVGACISAVGLTIFYNLIVDKVQLALVFLPVLSTWPLMFWICLILLLVGGGIGAVASYMSLHDYLVDE